MVINMKAYIISIAAAAVISALVSIISPAKWNKYIGIVTGLVVVMCIGQPLLKLMRTNVFERIEYNVQAQQTAGEDDFRKELKEELSRRLADDVKNRLRAEFGVDCSVSVSVSVDEDGKIAGVESMRISGGNIDTAAVGRLREVYGVKKVYYGGNEKITAKQE